MRRALAALVLVLAGLGSGQVWYYNVDQDNALLPDTLDFNPTAEQLMCAGLLEPGATPAGGATVSNLALPPGCPPAPPVLVYGTDPATDNTTYAILLVSKFWGQKRWQNATYGLDALLDELQQSYALQISASGDHDLVDAQFSPPWTTPPIDQPVSAATWYRWKDSQSLGLAEPEVSNRQNYSIIECVLNGIYFEDDEGNIIYDKCWSAELTWALPVRLVLHGNELGEFSIVLTPGLFERRTAATLMLRGAELINVQGKVRPFQR